MQFIGGFFFFQGVIPRIIIGDRVWDDQNGNGLQDNGEPGILGVQVRLLCNGVQQETTVSGANGLYRFSRTVQPNANCVEALHHQSY